MSQKNCSVVGKIPVALAMIGALVASGLVVLVVGNDLRIRQEQVIIPVPGGKLDAVLTSPPVEPRRGLVIFIHGSGPVDATNNGFFLFWFEAAADAGFSSLAWSKPGIGASTGKYLNQSMDDRAAEVSAALDWAKQQPQIQADLIVLWGGSQGGWVAPKVAARRTDITAYVGLSPAINWLRQDRFYQLTKLKNAGADAATLTRAGAIQDQQEQLLQQGANYQTYRATTSDPDPMTEADWTFASRNYQTDVTADLTALAAKNLPVLLLVADDDRYVDVAETEATYDRLLGDNLRVQRFRGAHSSAKTSMEDVPPLGVVTAVFWPRALYADGVLVGFRDYLAALAR